MNRVVGLETEYGCLCAEPLPPSAVVSRVRRWAFTERRLGLADTQQRDWDEPAGNGGFLFNGGRLYVDMGHLEYCTPECRSLRDLLLYDQAGDALLRQALSQLGLASQAGFVRNNIDHCTGATFGCHENFLVRRSAPLTEANVLSLLAFLTLRVLYTGAGRVGATAGAQFRGDLERAGADPGFQISQRADYINNELFEWVQFNRALINTRDEPLADPRHYRRLHLLLGDTNVLPESLALKIGTTALVLDLLEAGQLPRIALADAVLTFRLLSHQTDGPWRVFLADGSRADALELLQAYCTAAWRELHGRDPETDLTLRLWKRTLRALDQDPESLVGRVDWITKRWLLCQFVQAEHIAWNHPWLAAQDLEYHHLDPQRNLGWPLAHPNNPWTFTPADTAHATEQPPPDTRAHARAAAMRALAPSGLRYYVDWEVIDAEGLPALTLGDPLEPRPPELRAWQVLLARELPALTRAPATPPPNG
ncbi:MAG: peptidase [Verrucomicrobia bacterium]|nr:peptidase [Verrucomicrobiota bacterium]